MALKIEVILAFTDHTWETKTIPIPQNTPAYKVEDMAKGRAVEEWEKLHKGMDYITEIAFIDIYDKGWLEG